MSAVAKNVSDANTAAQETSKGVVHVASAIQELSELGASLQLVIGRFKLNDDDPNHDDGGRTEVRVLAPGKEE